MYRTGGSPRGLSRGTTRRIVPPDATRYRPWEDQTSIVTGLSNPTQPSASCAGGRMGWYQGLGEASDGGGEGGDVGTQHVYKKCKHMF